MIQKLPKQSINNIYSFISPPAADILNQGLEFAEGRMREYDELYIRCDCCAELWVECRCVCSNCYGNYNECCYDCFNDEWIMSHTS